MRTILLVLSLTILQFGGSCSEAEAMDMFIALGTGSTNGTYYPVGRAVCELLNARRMETGVRCIQYATGGAVYNIEAVRAGELEIGIARSDLAFQSYANEGEFAGLAANKDLRTIAALYSMPIAIVVRKDAGPVTFHDLPSLRFNVGNRGSGKRAASDLLFRVMAWNTDDFPALMELPTSRMEQAFCDGSVDAVLEGLGHPSPLYKRLIEECDGRFLAVPADVISRIKEEVAAIDSMPIPGGLYAGADSDVPTFGVKAVLVTSRKLHPETVYVVTRTIFENLDDFRSRHPTLELLSAEEMANAGTYVPLHEGAQRYFEEVGIIGSK